MDLRQLRHFIAVVEQGSLSRAAEKVCLTQPALTRSIQLLEDSVGVRLLDRGINGATPTPAGEAMYQHARFMMQASERARQDARASAAGGRDRVVVAIDPQFPAHAVRAAIAAHVAGGACVSLRSGFVDGCVDLLLDGVADVAVAVVPPAAMGVALAYERLCPVEMAVYAASDHPLAGRGGLTRADLVGQRWALIDRPFAQEALVRFFTAGRQGLPADLLRVDDLALQAELVLRQQCLALMPAHRLVGQDAVALAVSGMPLVHQAGLLYLPHEGMRPSVAAMIEALRGLAPG
ncbi:MAG TPA: LysR family transcriptional regulator [Novosphingobium sp.]|nr:LysR family transcriptional regulator [Novosphingobium sp.]